MARVTALIPAHNEQDTIADALWALKQQTRQPDRVIVVLDNCTDNTRERMWAFERGWIAEAFYTSGNRDKKAGALNQALSVVDPQDDDLILVQDADSFLDAEFVEEAVNSLQSEELGAVGGTFRGRPEGNYLSFCQRSEFIRYQRDTSRLRGKALTLTGTAMVFKGCALRQLADSRNDGLFYTVSNLTEDLEVSVRLMNMGWKIQAPRRLTLTTEVMPTLGELYKQRLRWREGAVRTVMEYGFVRGCRELSLRLVYSFFGILVLFAYLTTIVYAIGAGSFTILPFWIGVSAVFAAEQFVSVHRGGVGRAIVGGMLLVEMPYMIFLQAVSFVAYIRALTRPSKGW